MTPLRELADYDKGRRTGGLGHGVARGNGMSKTLGLPEASVPYFFLLNSILKGVMRKIFQSSQRLWLYTYIRSYLILSCTFTR